jgi:hypothetical protein
MGQPLPLPIKIVMAGATGPISMRLPRFTTLQLVLITTLAALVAGLFTSAWKWRPVWTLVEVTHPNSAVPQPGPIQVFTERRLYADAVPLSARAVPMAASIAGFAAWGVAWGIVRKRGRESLAKIGAPGTKDHPRQRLPTPSPPLALTACWGLMIVGGLVALGIPIALMFTIGPLLFPTIYFSLFVGLAAIARGAARDSMNLKRTASLQLANMIALDLANVVFAAMEFALLRTDRVKAYLESTKGRSSK